MIIPFVASLTDDALSAVPQSLKEGSLAMGATLSKQPTKLLSQHHFMVSQAVSYWLSRAIWET